MSRLTKKINRRYEISANYEEISSEYVITQKLGQLEDIEEELGCPLEVVFRAMKCGIEFEHKITNEKLISKSIRVYYFQNKWKIRAYIERYNTKDAFDRDLKDYQKTWWLKGEKNEKEN